MLTDAPPSLPATRSALQQVAVHVLARRRHAYTERFGLLPAPGGIATPAFGDDIEIVRTSGRFLVVERSGFTTSAPITTLAAAAELVGVDLGLEFAVGGSTPPMAEPAAPLGVDDEAARAVADWWAFGQSVIDEVAASTPSVTAATRVQLWPEHFDVGGTITVSGDGGTDAGPRLNLGASPGDTFEPYPYLYLSPWAGERPGDPGFWNASFGAVLRHAEVAKLDGPDQRAVALAFLRRGLAMFERP
ncbi:MAG TPA: hypothetical protein VK306_11285 [Acidimicrobiales bacterium]|nr:hypothetical protein [Acidimicrobiales bacterium]